MLSGYVQCNPYSSVPSPHLSARVQIGFAVAVMCTLYIMRSSYRGRHKQSRVYHYISALVRFGAKYLTPTRLHLLSTQITLIMSLAYLTMAIGSMSDSPLKGFENVEIVQFCDWIVGTPLLLIDLCTLAKLEIPEVGVALRSYAQG